MITIPFYIFFFIYLALAAIIFIFFLINIGHLSGTGNLTFVSFCFTLFVLAAGVILIWYTWYLLAQISVDWKSTVTIWDNTWVTGLLNSSHLN